MSESRWTTAGLVYTLIKSMDFEDLIEDMEYEVNECEDVYIGDCVSISVTIKKDILLKKDSGNLKLRVRK